MRAPLISLLYYTDFSGSSRYVVTIKLKSETRHMEDSAKSVKELDNIVNLEDEKNEMSHVEKRAASIFSMKNQGGLEIFRTNATRNLLDRK